ncbi:hypothetical protein BIFGAL_04207 [Bifidobacterium gallicum DSM 20093 = LMG 11596]|uniref:Uncharacterized protein n=1 Tax=Bifidobacterium gallicum DSM 20093 = LMG 11596 TaxID=561180 RepID=D1NWF7_9BIFI|nr:hypothetical protein BIFGAL_04207 [Bifidobacterium gallicum DSM 20093 = LMG 11596]
MTAGNQYGRSRTQQPAPALNHGCASVHGNRKGIWSLGRYH